MFHRHVVALFYHGIFVRYVRTWAYGLVRARLVNVAIEPLVLESALACVENNCIL